MRSIVQHRLGAPSDVLKVVDSEAPPPSSKSVAVRVTHAPVHPGDLLGVRGAPAFGTAPAIPTVGRVPGFEALGIIEAIGVEIDAAQKLAVGMRVALFPITEAWSGQVNVDPTSIVPLPEEMPVEIGAQLLLNTIIARIIVRAGLQTDGVRDHAAPIIQTGASSSVALRLSAFLQEQGHTPLRLVRSQSSADALLRQLPVGPVLATEADAWREQARGYVGNLGSPLCLDGVGGPLLADIVELLRDGSSIISYGSLSGAGADIRKVAPRGLSLRGVNIGQWSRAPPAVRQDDIAAALKLGREKPELFQVAGRFDASDVAHAVQAVEDQRAAGIVLLTF